MKNANGVIKKLTSAERSYYTAAEVREMMGVSRDTAYRICPRKESLTHRLKSRSFLVWTA